jgi:hypothetical protein
MDSYVEARIEADACRAGVLEIKLTAEELKGVGGAFTFGWGSTRVPNG